MISKPLIVAIAVFIVWKPRRSDDPFERTMICFDDVVQVLRCAMSCVFGQLTVTLEPVDGFRIRGKLVGCDRCRRPVPHDCGSFALPLLVIVTDCTPSVVSVDPSAVGVANPRVGASA
jgi:hypothetical protein